MVAPDTDATEQRRITVLGSTGSVGINTLDLVARNPKQFKVAALSAGQNVDLLIEQARKLRPEFVVSADEAS